MIELNETIRAVYFAAGRQEDWLAAVSDAPEGGVKIVYRFRYYDPKDPDNDSFSGKDRKNWYESSGVPLEAALAAMQKLLDEMIAVGYCPPGAPACKLVRGSMTVEQFYEEFKKLPFVHAKEELQ